MQTLKATASMAAHLANLSTKVRERCGASLPPLWVSLWRAGASSRAQLQLT